MLWWLPGQEFLKRQCPNFQPLNQEVKFSLRDIWYITTQCNSYKMLLCGWNKHNAASLMYISSTICGAEGQVAQNEASMIFTFGFDFLKRWNEINKTLCPKSKPFCRISKQWQFAMTQCVCIIWQVRAFHHLGSSCCDVFQTMGRWWRLCQSSKTTGK